MRAALQHLPRQRSRHRRHRRRGKGAADGAEQWREPQRVADAEARLVDQHAPRGWRGDPAPGATTQRGGGAGLGGMGRAGPEPDEGSAGCRR